MLLEISPELAKELSRATGRLARMQFERCPACPELVEGSLTCQKDLSFTFVRRSAKVGRNEQQDQVCSVGRSAWLLCVVFELFADSCQSTIEPTQKYLRQHR